MFLLKTRRFLLLLFSLSLFTTQNLQAREGFQLNWSNIQDIIDHIACDYNMEISEAQLASWLEGLLSGTGDCGSVEELWSTGSSSKSEGFRWRPVPGAKGYKVSSLGLEDGRRTSDDIAVAKHDFAPLTLQPYIFSFIIPANPIITSMYTILTGSLPARY